MKGNKSIKEKIDTDKNMIIYHVIMYIFFIMIIPRGYHNNLSGLFQDFTFRLFSILSIIVVIFRILRIKHLRKKEDI